MKRIYLAFCAVGLLSLYSCDKVNDVIEVIDEFDDGINDSTTSEGLKEALRVGTDTATSILSVQNGYFADQAVKILLPNEIETAINNFKAKTVSLGSLPILGEISVTGEDLYSGYSNSTLGINIPSLKEKEDDLILGLNRGAEAAASTAGPIFWSAITDMSILDATSILFADNDTAATHYLRENTYPNLYNNFEPKLDSTLAIVKVGNKSVVELYEDYVSTYNSVLNTAIPGSSSIGSQMGLNTVAAEDISAYATDKGLSGLFLKVSDEERDIRLNPLARINDLLETVFGQLDE